MNKTIRNVCLLAGIVWIMTNLCSVECMAKTAFSKTKPVGIMSTAVDTNIVLTWEPVDGANGYVIYEAIEDVTSDGEDKLSYGDIMSTTSCKKILTEKLRGNIYHYYVKAYKTKKDGTKEYSKASKKVSTSVALVGKSTVKNFLQTAISPMGSTMYVWGGGWNKADTAAGTDAKRTGLSPKWRSFAKNKKASYNYQNYRYQIRNGLDCSGYVGWCVYNVMNTKNGGKGYVYSASKQAKKFAEAGFGTYYSAKKIKKYQAGDIMSSTCNCCGHVWIVVGQCKDGSVVLVHSSPAGVQLSGTVTPSGKKKSQAYALAKKYMKKYYPAWYKRYPNVSRGSSYLSHYGQMKWYTTGTKTVLSDTEGYRNMTADKVLKDLFGE